MILGRIVHKFQKAHCIQEAQLQLLQFFNYLPWQYLVIVTLWWLWLQHPLRYIYLLILCRMYFSIIRCVAFLVKFLCDCTIFCRPYWLLVGGSAISSDGSFFSWDIIKNISKDTQEVLQSWGTALSTHRKEISETNENKRNATYETTDAVWPGSALFAYTVLLETLVYKILGHLEGWAQD